MWAETLSPTIVITYLTNTCTNLCAIFASCKEVGVYKQMSYIVGAHTLLDQQLVKQPTDKSKVTVNIYVILGIFTLA